MDILQSFGYHKLCDPKSLITKLAIDSNNEAAARKSLKHLLEWETMLALPFSLPILCG
jgi:hypothetical protein